MFSKYINNCFYNFDEEKRQLESGHQQGSLEKPKPQLTQDLRVMI